jgi:uncharacterized protein YpmB
MNARKVISILGLVCLVIVLSIIAVALFAIKKVETDANRQKTEAARRARWSREPQKANEGALSEKKIPCGAIREWGKLRTRKFNACS